MNYFNKVILSGIVLITMTTSMSWADLRVGAKVFERKCLPCHHEGGMGPDLSGVALRRDEAYLINKLRNPKDTDPDTIMPSFDNLSDSDFNSLVEYLLTLR